MKHTIQNYLVEHTRHRSTTNRYHGTDCEPRGENIQDACVLNQGLCGRYQTSLRVCRKNAQLRRNIDIFLAWGLSISAAAVVFQAQSRASQTPAAREGRGFTTTQYNTALYCTIVVLYIERRGSSTPRGIFSHNRLLYTDAIRTQKWFRRYRSRNVEGL